MRRELIERAFSSIFPSPVRAPGVVHGQKINTVAQSGTTVVAFRYKDGLIMAADRKTSGGYFFIDNLEAMKIHEVAVHTGFGAAGAVAHIQLVLHELELINSSFRSRARHPLSVRGQVNYISNMIRDYSLYVCPWGLEAHSLIAGIDHEGASIYGIFVDGAVLEYPYSSVGSGSDQAIARLDQEQRQLKAGSFKEKAAIELALRAIRQAGLRDSGSSDLRTALPSVAKITYKNGFEFIDEDVLKPVVAGLVEELKS